MSDSDGARFYDEDFIRNGLWSKINRRDALKLAGASVALAALSACNLGTAKSSSGALRLIGDQVITNLDPRLSLGPDGVIIRRSVFHTLLSIDSATGAVSPLLAAELPKQEDDLTWTVRIRSGIKNQDGSTLSADDIKYTVDWVLDPANASIFGSVVLDGVKSIEVVDPTTVRFHLSRVLGSFVERLAAFAPVPKAAAVAAGATGFKTKPVGYGPFTVGDFKPNDHYTLNRWDGYSAGPRAELSTVTLTEILDGAARVNALRAGQADVDLDVDPALVAVAGNSGVSLLPNHNDGDYTAFFMNLGIKPFDDIRVRQAAAHAINRDEIVKVIYNGKATPMHGALPPWYFMADPNIPKLEFDPEKSKSLLASAGHAPGKLTFELLQGTYSSGLQMAALLQSQLQTAGFKVNIKTGDPEGLYTYLFDKTFQAFSLRGNTTIVGLYPDVMTRWVYQQVFNNGPDSLIAPLTKAFQDADAIPASNLAARKAAYSKVQAMQAAAVTVVFLVNVQTTTAVSTKIGGIRMAPDDAPYSLVGVTRG